MFITVPRHICGAVAVHLGSLSLFKIVVEMLELLFVCFFSRALSSIMIHCDHGIVVADVLDQSILQKDGLQVLHYPIESRLVIQANHSRFIAFFVSRRFFSGPGCVWPMCVVFFF